MNIKFPSMIVLLTLILLLGMSYSLWWNSSWNYSIPIKLYPNGFNKSGFQSNLYNFPFRIDLNTSNSTLWNTTTCTNVRFVSSDNLTSYLYDLDSDDTTFCGNETNNATFWVSIPFIQYRTNATTIYAYLGNVNSSSGENESNVWTNAKYISVYHGNDNTDSVGVNNLTGTIPYIINSTKCKIGKCFEFNSTTVYLSKTSPNGLPTGVNNLTMTTYAWKESTPNVTDTYALMGYNSRYGMHEGNTSKYRTVPYNYLVPNDITANSTGLHTYMSEWHPANTNSRYDNNSMVYGGGSFSWSTNIDTLYIGTMSTTTNTWSKDAAGATIDEMRLRNESSSLDWLNAEWYQSTSSGNVTSFQNEISNIIISPPIDIIPYNTTNLTCNVTAFDIIPTNNVTVSWYKNGVLQSLNQTTEISTNVNTLVSTLNYGNLSIGENWSCGAYTNNGITNTSFIMSNNVTIGKNETWNTSWSYIIPIYINSTVNSSLTNFPAKISMNTSNRYLWNTTRCTNVRFIDENNVTILNYDLDSNSSVFCGNETNNATFWVSIPFLTNNSNKTIYAYLGNTNATSIENSTNTWGSLGANYISVYHGNDYNDELGLNTLSQERPTMTFASNSSCFIGNCFYMSTAGSSFAKRIPVGLVTSNNPSTVSLYGSRSENLTQATALFYAGTTSNLNSRGISFVLIGSEVLLYGSTRDYTVTYNLSNNTFGKKPYGYFGLSFYPNATATIFFNKTYRSGNDIYSNATSNGNLIFGECQLPSCTLLSNSAAGSVIDEIRISNITRSTDWMNAEFAQTSTYGALQGATKPVITSLLIWPIPAMTTKNLSCNITVTGDLASYNTTYSWYKNGILNLTGSATINNNSNSLLSTILSGNLTLNDNWSCSAFTTGVIDSDTNSTSNVTIQELITITFINQTPSDITSTNIISQRVHIIYNVSSSAVLNNSSVTMYYKTNNSLNDITAYHNGTVDIGFESDVLPTQNGSLFEWAYGDNEIYPHTENVQDSILRNIAHNQTTLVSQSDYFMTEFLNVSNTSQYGFYEQMFNASSATPVRIYICNNTTSNPNIPNTNANCGQIASIIANGAYDHTHNNSGHRLIPFTVNTTTGTVAGTNVKITKNMYFLIRGNNGQTINVSQVSIFIRTGATKTTTNNGNAWTNRTYISDSHLHQYNGNDTFHYYVCANTTTGESSCSSVRSDLLDLGGLPPSGTNIIVPDPAVYNYTNDIPINITWTPALSPNGYAIDHYNISLQNSDGSFNKTIVANTTGINYSWNASNISKGIYRIQIQVYDNMSQSTTTAVEFGLTYPKLSISQYNPSDNSIYYKPNVIFNYTLNNVIKVSNNTTVQLFIDDVLNISNITSDITNFIQNISIPNGTHTWYIYTFITNDTSENFTSPVLAFNVSTLGCVGNNYVFTEGEHVNESCTLNTNITVNGQIGFYLHDNVTLNCNGYSISGIDSEFSEGLVSSWNNITIKNCLIKQFDYSVYSMGGNNILIENSTLNLSNSNALYASNVQNISLINSYLWSANSHTIEGYLMSNFSVVNTTIYSEMSQPVYIMISNNITFDNVTAGPDYTDFDQCSDVIIKNSNFTTINANLHALGFLTSTNVNISNNTISSYGDIGTEYGALSILGSTNVIAKNNRINGQNGDIALSVGEYSSNNIIFNNTITNSSILIYIPSASTNDNNTFYLNNLSLANTYYIDDQGNNNIYNMSEGNIYDEINNGTINISGNISSSIAGFYIGEYGVDYPLNSTNSHGKINGIAVDYSPLTNKLYLQSISGSISNVVNSTTGHWFIFNATFIDPNKAINVSSYSLNSTFGSCIKLSNSTINDTLKIKYNCSSMTQGSNIFNVTMTDNNSINYTTNTITNAYPDNSPSITRPTITPSSPLINDTLICNPGTFSDIDGDSENVSSRTWQWVLNGTTILPVTTQTIDRTYFNKTDLIHCVENVSANNWSNITSNLSTQVGIRNEILVKSKSYSTLNSNINHWFILNVSFVFNENTTINTATLTKTFGTCNQLSNLSTNDTFNTIYNCSSLSQGSNIMNLSLVDNQTATASFDNMQNTYPDNTPTVTQPMVTVFVLPGLNGTVQQNVTQTDTLLCENFTYSDIDNDTQNTSATSYSWYRNGHIILNETSNSLDLSTYQNGSNFTCGINVYSNNWTTNVGSNNSSNWAWIPGPIVSVNLTDFYLSPPNGYYGGDVGCSFIPTGNNENVSFVVKIKDGTNTIKASTTVLNYSNGTLYNNSNLLSNSLVNIGTYYTCEVTITDGISTDTFSTQYTVIVQNPSIISTPIIGSSGGTGITTIPNISTNISSNETMNITEVTPAFSFAFLNSTIGNNVPYSYILGLVGIIFFIILLKRKGLIYDILKIALIVITLILFLVPSMINF